MSDETNAAEYVSTAMRGRLDDLAALHSVIDGEADQVDEATMIGLDIGAEYDDHELRTEPYGDQAQDALDTYALCTESTVLYEVVFGTGGPDDRLIVECDCDDEGRPAGIRRILYRYSWSGSAERVLSGEDFDTAERYARSVLPALEAI